MNLDRLFPQIKSGSDLLMRHEKSKTRSLVRIEEKLWEHFEATFSAKCLCRLVILFFLMQSQMTIHIGYMSSESK